jgi:predicted adenine nucleotide alpha hydrolase (AANH) superfamily ATPase
MNQNRTAILTCTCEHKYQDERYGKNKRLHNETEKGYRCTVCGNVKNK